MRMCVRVAKALIINVCGHKYRNENCLTQGGSRKRLRHHEIVQIVRVDLFHDEVEGDAKRRVGGAARKPSLRWTRHLTRAITRRVKRVYEYAPTDLALTFSP